ncbi:hypothetical protein MAM1_0108d05500 [Mucor ambiguus]|uniref:Uncharacterized protein n=1 Tax=Mucor ambiguus TaxID=91626 RepID=A0A0C9MFF5_9FUNG|nr:hypothetical protein MAM1_0108d05500 [Mucor ambiguus]
MIVVNHSGTNSANPVTTVLSSTAIQKPEFGAIPLATALVKSEIKSLDTQTKVLNACLIDKTSPSYVAAANALVTQINIFFAFARAAYNNLVSYYTPKRKTLIYLQPKSDVYLI